MNYLKCSISENDVQSFESHPNMLQTLTCCSVCIQTVSRLRMLMDDTFRQLNKSLFTEEISIHHWICCKNRFLKKNDNFGSQFLES